MDVLILSYLFVIGLIFGSFALALADRIHVGRDWVKDRSRCESCNHILSPLDLIPVFSWLALKGRCRYCKKRVGWSYPIAELFSGALFVVSYIYFPFDLVGAGYLLFMIWLLSLVVAVALFFYDLRWFLLPDGLLYSWIGFGVLHFITARIISDQAIIASIIAVASALVVSAGLFWLLHTYSKGKWLGSGDIFLAVAIAFFLADPLKVWLVLFVASVSGVVIAAPSLISKKRTLSAKIPYGPFLIIGLVVSYLFGDRLIDWYSSMFLFI